MRENRGKNIERKIDPNVIRTKARYSSDSRINIKIMKRYRGHKEHNRNNKSKGASLTILDLNIETIKS